MAESQNLGGVVGGIVGPVVNDPVVKQMLLQAIIQAITGWLSGIFNKKPKPPTVPVTAPTPAPSQPDPSFPDDHIPRPPTTRKVARVRIKLERVQLSKERFPNEYTPENPFGLVSPGPIQAGSNMNWGSKFWVDLTAYDEQGKEFLRPDVLTYGLAYKTEIRVGDAVQKGLGALPDGTPVPGYVSQGTDAIGHGITAWLSSFGFLHQMQAFAAADGQKFRVTGFVDGVEAENPFDLGVS